MNDLSNAAPWFTDEYCRIERCSFDQDTDILSVTFADGDVAEVNPRSLVPESLREVDWWRVAWNEGELVVPYADGWYEVPWDVVRMQTDSAFDAHMTRRGSFVDAEAAVR